MCESRGLPLGETGVGWLVHACSRCSPSKGGNSLHSPRNARFGILFRLKPTRKWSNTIIHIGGNISLVFLSFLLFSFLTASSWWGEAPWIPRALPLFLFEHQNQCDPPKVYDCADSVAHTKLTSHCHKFQWVCLSLTYIVDHLLSQMHLLGRYRKTLKQLKRVLKKRFSNPIRLMVIFGYNQSIFGPVWEVSTQQVVDGHTV